MACLQAYAGIVSYLFYLFSVYNLIHLMALLIPHNMEHQAVE
jgi:hypothetical protein